MTAKKSVAIGRYMVAVESGSEWCITNRRGQFLGAILWSATWRKFEFAPDSNTMFTSDCLAPLADFLKGLTGRHRCNSGVTDADRTTAGDPRA